MSETDPRNELGRVSAVPDPVLRDALARMDRSVRCLALELHPDVHNAVSVVWSHLVATLGDPAVLARKLELADRVLACSLLSDDDDTIICDNWMCFDASSLLQALLETGDGGVQ